MTGDPVCPIHGFNPCRCFDYPLRQPGHAFSFTPDITALLEDKRRLDWLEGEMERELTRTVKHPLSLFRRNTPITRADIDAAIAETEGHSQDTGFVQAVCGIAYQSPYRGNPAMPSGDNWVCAKCGYSSKHDSHPGCQQQFMEGPST